MRTYKTLQEIFNGVWDHFIVKKNPQSRGDGETTPRCKYGLTGCAIGCLIDDKDLCNLMDNRGGTISTILGSNKEYVPKVLEIFPYLEDDKDRKKRRALQELQSAHDSYYDGDHPAELFIDHIKARLEAFAKDYNLEIPNENVPNPAVGV